MIETKNKQAKAQQNYVKELTKKKKAEAKDKAIEEVSLLNEDAIEFMND